MKHIFTKPDRFFGKWRIAVLDERSGRWVVEPRPSNIPYLKAENANGRHILIQPVFQSFFMLVDDILPIHLQSQHKRSNDTWKAGRLIIETSKNNFQVWIRSGRPLSLDEKRYWLQKMHSDPGADPNNRWGRCPGFRNRKQKHMRPDGKYPLARLIWIDWRNKAEIPLLYKEDSTTQTAPFSSRDKRTTISRSDYFSPDASSTDFAYALALFRRKFPEDEVYRRILTERADWSHHSGENQKKSYLQRTIAKAKAIVNNSC